MRVRFTFSLARTKQASTKFCNHWSRKTARACAKKRGHHGKHKFVWHDSTIMEKFAVAKMAREIREFEDERILAAMKRA